MRWWHHCFSVRAIIITYSECLLVASVIQHAMRMRHIVICGLPSSTTECLLVNLVIHQAMRMRHIGIVACPTLQYFSTLSHKRQDFRGKKKKKIIKGKMCFDFVYSFSQKHLSFWEELSEILSKMFVRHRVKYPLFLSDLSETWIFSIYFRKLFKYNISRKSFHWEPIFFFMRTDGQAWRSA